MSDDKRWDDTLESMVQLYERQHLEIAADDRIDSCSKADAFGAAMAARRMYDKAEKRVRDLESQIAAEKAKIREVAEIVYHAAYNDGENQYAKSPDAILGETIDRLTDREVEVVRVPSQKERTGKPTDTSKPMTLRLVDRWGFVAHEIDLDYDEPLYLVREVDRG